MYACVLKKKKISSIDFFILYLHIYKKNSKNANILFNDITFGDVFI